MSEILKELQELRAQTKAANEAVLAKAEAAVKEAEKHGTLSTEAKAKADEALAEAHTSRQKLNALEARLGEAEQKYAALPTGGANAQKISIGATVAQHERIQAFVEQAKSGLKGSASVAIKANLLSTTMAGGLVQPHYVGLIQPNIIRLTLRDLLAVGRTESNSIHFVQERFNNQANTQREGKNKNESDLAYVPESAPVVTIAHFIYATEQVLDDAPMLESYINTRLLHGLALAEEKQILKGTGINLNMKGLMHYGTDYKNPNAAIDDSSNVDKLRMALLQMELNQIYADGIVLRPTDWAEIELAKDANGKYLFTDPFGQTAIKRLWGIPTVTTPNLDENEFLVGAFATCAQLWDRQDANVVLSNENRDNFERNTVTIRAEHRVALTVYNTAGFVKGKFA